MREILFFMAEETRHNVLVFLFFVCAFVIAIWGTWDMVLQPGEEAMLAEAAREITVSGRIYPLHFAGEPSYGLPPMASWATSICLGILGVNDFAVRFIFVVFSIACSLLLVLAGKEVSKDMARVDYAAYKEGSLNKRLPVPDAVGILAAMVLASTPHFARYAPHLSTGLPLAFFTTMAFLGWMRLPERKGGAVLWGAGILGGILSVGAAGLLPVLAGAVAMVVVREKRALWRRSSFIIPTVLGLVLGIVWLVPASIESGGWRSSPLWLPFSAYFDRGSISAAAFVQAASLVWLRSLPWAIVATLAFVRILFQSGERRSKSLVGEKDYAILAFIFMIFIPLAVYRGIGLSALLPVAPLAAILMAREIARWLLPRAGNLGERIWAVNKLLAALFCFMMLLVISTIVSIRTSSDDPIKEIAAVANRITSVGESIGNYRQSVDTYRARILFYGDRRLEDELTVPEDVIGVLKAEPRKVFLASQKDVIALRETGDLLGRIRILYGAGELVLFGLEHEQND